MRDTYDQYGRSVGYGQMAPGRDLEPLDGQQERQGGVINNAITGGMPVGNTPFKGAQQTIGAKAPQAPAPIDSLFAGASGGYAAPEHNAPYETGGYTGGTAAKPVETPAAPAPTYDTSHWNTKGYATPQYIAQSIGAAPSGWDQTKWADANYQDPKYVVGRLEMEASGGDGVFNTPEEKQRAVDAILKAYPGATFDGKDHINFHDGGAAVDVFKNAGTGTPSMSFAPDEVGGQAQGSPMGLPIQNAIMGNAIPGQPSSDFASRLRQQIMDALMANPNLASLLPR